MSYSVLNSVVAQSLGGGDTCTSSAIDTTGADLIVAVVQFNKQFTILSGMTFSDSKSNSWTALPEYFGGSNTDTLFYYCYAPTVGVGHTFTFQATPNLGASTQPALAVIAASGSITAPADLNNGNGNNWFDIRDTLICGSITPSVNGCLIVSGAAYFIGGNLPETMNLTTMTIQKQISDALGQRGIAIATNIQTISTTVAPAWICTPSGSYPNGAVMVASFKPGAGTPTQKSYVVGNASLGNLW